jgi:hypothetical protein
MITRFMAWTASLLGVFVLSSTLILAGCKKSDVGSSAGKSPEPDNTSHTDLTGKAAVPDTLMPPKGNVFVFELRAEGVQIYECKAVDGSAGEYAWVLKEPDAVLYDDRGEKAGTHFAGPAWQATDGSKIVATKLATANAPGEHAIPWLLLQVKSHDGDGTFAKVTYIQRVDTWAGQAPTAGANKENLGKTVRVKYQATYRFYRASE